MACSSVIGRVGGRSVVGVRDALRLGILALGDGPQLVGAEPPLAGAHGDGRVPLEQLGRLDALVDRDLEVLDADVLAEADGAVGAAACAGRTGRRRTSAGPAAAAWPAAVPLAAASSSVAPSPAASPAATAGRS